MAHLAQTNEPLVSEYAQDEEMLDLVEMFVNELPDRVESLQSAFNEQDWESVSRLAHQLKGSAGGYGFPTITDAAAALEQSTKSGGDHQAISEKLEELSSLCRRARAS